MRLSFQLQYRVLLSRHSSQYRQLPLRVHLDSLEATAAPPRRHRARRALAETGVIIVAVLLAGLGRTLSGSG
jgi:hypothetical protein